MVVLSCLCLPLLPPTSNRNPWHGFVLPPGHPRRHYRQFYPQTPEQREELTYVALRDRFQFFRLTVVAMAIREKRIFPSRFDSDGAVIAGVI